jgi:hypothetical protein
MSGLPLIIDVANNHDKILYPACNIQKSKEVVHVTYNARKSRTYLSLVLSTTYRNIYWLCP